MRRQSKNRTAPPRPSATVNQVRPAPADARARFDSVRQVVLPALVLVVITVAAFAPVVKAGYVWDDDLYVTGNPYLKDAAGLFAMWYRFGSTSM